MIVVRAMSVRYGWTDWDSGGITFDDGLDVAKEFFNRPNRVDAVEIRGDGKSKIFFSREQIERYQKLLSFE